MKYVVLLLKNARRNKRRTALTILSIAIAVFLFSSLRAILDGFQSAVESTSSTRIVTVRSTSVIFPMPISHYEVIKGIDGVRDITWASWFGVAAPRKLCRNCPLNNTPCVPNHGIQNAATSPSPPARDAPAAVVTPIMVMERLA